MEQTKELQQTVFDSKNNKWITVTPEEQKMAAYVHQQVLFFTLMKAIAIKKMFDERLYYALGCQSQEEYIDNMLPMSRTQAYRLYQLANKYDGVYQALYGKKMIPEYGEEISPNLGLNPEFIEITQDLGATKLGVLKDLDDEELVKLFKNKKVNLGDGELTMDEIIEFSYKQTAKKIQELKKKYSSKINEQEEAIKLLKEENKVLSKEAQSAKGALEAAEKDLNVFGPVKVKIQEKEEQISRARQMLIAFNRMIVRADVKVDDPEELRSMIEDIFRELVEVKDRVMRYYDEVLATTESKGVEWTPDPEVIKAIREKTKHIK